MRNGIQPAPERGRKTTWSQFLKAPLADKRFLILDRKSKFSLALRDLLEDAGVEVVRLPYRSPNLNAHAERFVRSIKDECLDQMIICGERSLRKATREYAAHYPKERNHQGIDNPLIEPQRSPRFVSVFGPYVQQHRIWSGHSRPKGSFLCR